MSTKYSAAIEHDRPFYILVPRRDITVWRVHKLPEYTLLEILFHGFREAVWRNPPTDTHIGSDAWKNIEKYGIVYLPDEYVDEYIDQPWGRGNEYRKDMANQVLGKVKA